MSYQLLVFFHLLGVIILGGALLFGQILQIRARRSKDVRFIAETYRTLYLIIVPFAPLGGIMLLATGIGLIYAGGYPIKGWLLVLILLFAFEALEGASHYLTHAKKLMVLSRNSLQQGKLTAELTKTMESRWANVFLYMDIPNFLIIMWLATFKPF